MRQLRRVYQRPDGSLAIVSPAWNDPVNGFGRTPHVTEEQWYNWAVAHKQPREWVSLGNIPITSLPQDRAHRDKWRMLAGRIQPDMTIPNRPHPKQALLDEIDRAATVPQLKVLLTKLVRGE